jgi:hypothetical protein
MGDIDTAREETLGRLAESRAEIRRILEPPQRSAPGEGVGPEETGDGVEAFPRSRTMKLLLSGRGAGTVGAVACGLLIARPALGFRLLRMLPAGAIGKMLLVKGIAALRSKRR